MALVKKAALGRRGARSIGENASVAPAAATDVRSTRAGSRAKKAITAVERIEQATHELASGLGQSAAAAAELQRNAEHMASGAEEAAGAAQESLGLIGHLRGHFREANMRAAASRGQAERLEKSFSETMAQIDASIAAIELNAKRQLGSVNVVETLEVAATRIGHVGETVSDLSEQTGMLALNASIEATRAGDDGRAFAIIADEVRQLAENSERNARDISDLAAQIADDVRAVADRIRSASRQATDEARKGAEVSVGLERSKAALVDVLEGAHEIAVAAIQADTAATEAERGAEQVASAAEEQSAAAAEALQAIEQQAASLEESQQTAAALGDLGARSGSVDASAIEQIAASAEELSATIQELSGASAQIQIAIEQIARGAQLQSAATLEASTAMGQIEASADIAQSRASSALARLDDVTETISAGSMTLSGLVEGVTKAVGETRTILSLLADLSDRTRQVEKIGDALALAALQTNMLGVSGSVEATRANQAGQGFTMVTADIRKLAGALAVNADDGRDVVRAIQDGIMAARRELDQIAAAGEAEAARNASLLARFADMQSELSATRADGGIILDGAEAIQRAAREVRAGCDEIAKAAELASDATREASAAALQQAQSAEMLAAVIEDIASLAASLSVQVPSDT